MPRSTTVSPSSAVETPALTKKSLRMSYQIARGEQGVLTFEPYKSAILPLWRFRTPSIAQKSSTDLENRFKAYEAAGDFVGMDMTRKFIQMGMTRSMRYARHKGGRKYAKAQDGSRGDELEASSGHLGRDEKMQASAIFREAWENVKSRRAYLEKKDEFLNEQRAWNRRIENNPEEGSKKMEEMG